MEGYVLLFELVISGQSRFVVAVFGDCLVSRGHGSDVIAALRLVLFVIGKLLARIEFACHKRCFFMFRCSI